jgi:hypothetical protein
MKKNLQNIFKLVCLLALTFSSKNSQAQVGAGAALNFDGANDKVSVPSTPTINFGLGDFSVEAKVKTSASNPNFAGIVAKDGTSAPLNGWQLLSYTNSIALEIHSPAGSLGVGNGLIGTTLLNNGAWHHVALVVTRATNNITLYVDGQIEANVTHTLVPTFSVSNINALLIGVERNSTTYFNGNIDEVRLWNVARTKCDINTYMNCEIPANSPGLCANYHFNQGIAAGSNATVTTLNDATSNANNGTLTNMALTGATSNWVAPGGVVSGFTTSLAPPSYTASSLVVCAGNTLVLSGTAGNTYSWSAGVTDNVAFTPTASSNYTFSGTNTVTSCTATAVANVTVNASPVISVNNGTICTGTSFTIVPSGASTYTIQGGNAVVSPTTTTSYSVTGTSSLGCASQSVAVSNVNVLLCTGLNQVTNGFDGLNLYPNPSNGAFIIDLPIAAEVKIFNSLGQLIYTEKMNSGKNPVNMLQYSNGIYIVQINNAENKVNYRIVKQ